MTDPIQKLGVSVSIMCYNEAPSLATVAAEIEQVLIGAGRPYDVTIIDDGSRDGSGEIADRLVREKPHFHVIHHPTNLGLGAVYRAGFYAGQQAAVTLFPADGQFPATIIPQFLDRLEGADMVLGYVPDLKKGRPVLLVLLSWIERLLYRVLIGKFPEFQGILMFRRKVLDGIQLTTTGRGWTIQMELILRVLRAGYRQVSEPTGIRPRASGTSRATTLRNAWSNFVQLLMLRSSL